MLTSRRYLDNKVVFFSAALLMMLATIMLLTKSVHADPYNYTSYLMDDNVFTNSSTMSAATIQTFLQNEGGGLASFSGVENCNVTIVPASDSAGYACNQTRSAAQIIYDASQNYGINPQAILATMQKEQSLVTTPNPTASQLNKAMGYGCADDGSGNCVTTFFQQVDNAAWQLRRDFQAVNGQDYQGHTAATYPCNGATRYYSAALKTGSNVTFYDDHSTAYANITMPNASTSSLYCYTPHVYPGSAAEYYSGSYNFDYFYNKWFGSPFFAQYDSQSSNPVVPAGSTVNLYVRYRNIGNSFWKDDTSTFPGYYPIHLATTSPINRSSMFHASSWPATGRPSGTFTKVYDSDGTYDATATAQHTVQPGQIVEFDFIVHVPANQSPGTYREYFQPIAEGSSTWNMDAWSYFDIGVTSASNQASYSSESSYPTLTAGGASTSAYFKFTNTGNTTWYDDTDTPVDQYSLHLATTSPINRGSIFNTGWSSASRPNLTFSKVYNSDGSQSSNQHAVQPGQIAEFDLSLAAPAGTTPGTYKEYFQPILEGSPYGSWNIGGQVWLGVNVQ